MKNNLAMNLLDSNTKKISTSGESRGLFHKKYDINKTKAINGINEKYDRYKWANKINDGKRVKIVSFVYMF